MGDMVIAPTWKTKNLKEAGFSGPWEEKGAYNMSKPKNVTVRIPRISPKQEDVFVSVNNYTCIVKRGVDVEVPDFVAEVLRHQEEMMETIALFEEAHK